MTSLSPSSSLHCSVLIIQRRSVHHCTPPPHYHHRHPTQQEGFPGSTIPDRTLNAMVPTRPRGKLPCSAPAEAVIRTLDTFRNRCRVGLRILHKREELQCFWIKSTTSTTSNFNDSLFYSKVYDLCFIVNTNLIKSKPKNDSSIFR